MSMIETRKNWGGCKPWREPDSNENLSSFGERMNIRHDVIPQWTHGRCIKIPESPLKAITHHAVKMIPIKSWVTAQWHAARVKLYVMHSLMIDLWLKKRTRFCLDGRSCMIWVSKWVRRIRIGMGYFQFPVFFFAGGVRKLLRSTAEWIRVRLLMCPTTYFHFLSRATCYRT